MTVPQHLVRGLQFDLEDGGVVLEYLLPMEDIRDNGLVRNHTLAVPDTDEFDDLIAGVQRKVSALLSFALARLAASDPVIPTDLGEPDPDAPSPYDNPLER